MVAWLGVLAPKRIKRIIAGALGHWGAPAFRGVEYLSNYGCCKNLLSGRISPLVPNT